MKSRILIQHLLECGAQSNPETPFLICEGVSATYGEVEARANQLAHVLLQHGLEPGGRVGLLAHNSPFYVEAYYGTLKAGGIVVPLNTASDGPGLARLLSRCQADLLVASTRLTKVAVDAVVACPRALTLGLEAARKSFELPSGLRHFLLDEARQGAVSEVPGVQRSGVDPASIIYTSGSTGEPKGATLLHCNILANTRSIVEYLDLRPDDRVLCVLPFYYVYGKSLLNTHAAVGGTVVVENRFAYPNVALDTLESESCTGLSGVPSTFATLLNHSNLAERKLAHLRYVTQAGGAMSPELTRRLVAALPRTEIFIMYGATEASARLSYLHPSDLPRKIGSIGKAISGIELRVLRPDGSEAGVGEEGEIVARGSSIMSGYWGDPEGTSEVLDEAGYHTGDLARRDEEGFFYITGRRRDFIKAGAHRISTKEIEEAIHELPDIHEVAAIGVPDEIMGERIRVYVVALDGRQIDASQLSRALKRKLPAYKVPSEILFRGELPKNESGKIMKEVLRQESPAE